MSATTPHLFLCNDAPGPKTAPKDVRVEILEHRESKKGQNINLLLPRFVEDMGHIPDRILDLLEIAAYVFAADRFALRGKSEAVEYHAWARDMRFAIRIRDKKFWSSRETRDKLTAALQFMTGDISYDFKFLSGHSTQPFNLLDKEEFALQKKGPVSVVLFSGGLDSLAGTLQRLETTGESVCLISHQSGGPVTKRTQRLLVDALRLKYKTRINHYAFGCGLKGVRAPDENQRTRAFLFASTAFAPRLARCLGLNVAYAYENGITSLNLLRRQDLINSRASRTTHPKTLALMSDLLSTVNEGEFKIVNPLWDQTKADVLKIVDKHGGRDLVSSSVSCSTTYKRDQNRTHCGTCFQCLDRRLASYSAQMEDVDDAGIYSDDVFTQSITKEESRMTVLDYIRQADELSKMTDDKFYVDRMSELVDVVDHIGARTEEEALAAIYNLCHRHGDQVMKKALQNVRSKLDDLGRPLAPGSLLALLSTREHLKSDPERLATRIAGHLIKGLRLAYRKTKPDDEGQLNDQIAALLSGEEERFQREFPATTFALAKVVPDHDNPTAGLIIEAKYIRGKTPPSKASEGIAADITKYPVGKYILFVVYDPDGSVSDDEKFKSDIEDKRACKVAIVR